VRCGEVALVAENTSYIPVPIVVVSARLDSIASWPSRCLQYATDHFVNRSLEVIMVYKQWLEIKRGKFGKVEVIRYRMLFILFVPVFYSRVVTELQG
jgi:hypothetical protein